MDLPAEESGVITLKANEGDAVEVGAVVCLIDTSATAPKSSVKKELEEVVEKDPAPKIKVNEDDQEKTSFATGTPSQESAKMLTEHYIPISPISVSGKGGRITTADAVKA